MRVILTGSPGHAGASLPASRGKRDLHLQALDLPRRAPCVGLQALDDGRGVLGGRVQRREHRPKRGALPLRDVEGARAGYCLDAPHAGRHPPFLEDEEHPDVSGGADVGTATKLQAEAGDGHHTDTVAVLLTEERHGARCDRFLGGAHLGLDRRVPSDFCVDEALDLRKFVVRDGGEVDEVEPQPVGRDKRTSLLHVPAEHLPQRRVEEVGGGVIPSRRVPHLVRHFRRHDLVDSKGAPRDVNRVEPRASCRIPQHALHAGFRAVGAEQPPLVRDLASRLEVERRSRQRDVAPGPLFERCPPNSFLVEKADHRHTRQRCRLVPRELVPGPREAFLALRRNRHGQPLRSSLERAARTRPFPLAFHGTLEPLVIDCEPALAREVVHEVEWDAEGVIEPEGLLARHRPPCAFRAIERLLQPRQAGCQHCIEPVLFAPDDPDDVFLGPRQ